MDTLPLTLVILRAHAFTTNSTRDTRPVEKEITRIVDHGTVFAGGPVGRADSSQLSGGLQAEVPIFGMHPLGPRKEPPLHPSPLIFVLIADLFNIVGCSRGVTAFRSGITGAHKSLISSP